MPSAVREIQHHTPSARHAQVPLDVLTEHPRCARIFAAVVYLLGTRRHAKIGLQTIADLLGVSISTAQRDLRAAERAGLLVTKPTRYQSYITAWRRRSPHSDQPFVMVNSQIFAAARGLSVELFAELLRWLYTIGPQGATRKTARRFAEKWHGTATPGLIGATNRRRGQLVDAGLLVAIERPGRATVTALPDSDAVRNAGATMRETRPNAAEPTPDVTGVPTPDVTGHPENTVSQIPINARRRQTSFGDDQQEVDSAQTTHPECDWPNVRTAAREAARGEVGCRTCADVRRNGGKVIPDRLPSGVHDLVHGLREALLEAFPSWHRSVDCVVSRTVVGVYFEGASDTDGIAKELRRVLRRWEKLYDPFTDTYRDAAGHPIRTPEYVLAIAAGAVQWDTVNENDTHAHELFRNWNRAQANAA